MHTFQILSIVGTWYFAVTTAYPARNLGKSPGEYGEYFQGDILGIPFDSLSGIIGDEYRWDEAVLVYEIDPAFDRQDNLLIQTGMAHIEKYTCIRFKERTTENDYVFVRQVSSGYSSSVGKVGGRQFLNLEGNLVEDDRFGTVVHEFIHALGYFHEQSRTDRDDYVTINYDNIQDGYEHNFEKYSQDYISPFNTTYDYNSIMHYNAHGFAIDPTIPTIIVPEGITIGQRVSLSDKDIQKLRNMYCN